MKEFSISRADLISNNYDNSAVSDINEDSQTSNFTTILQQKPEAIIVVIINDMIAKEGMKL